MADGTEIRDGRFRVTTLHETSLVNGGDDPSARGIFERVWARLPPFREDNSFVALDDDGGVFLKGQRIRPRMRVEALRQAGRLVRETRYLRVLHERGVAVPEILAHGVERRLGCSVRAFLLLRHVPGAEDLRSFVSRTSAEERADLWEPVARAVARLHDADVYHRDLTARNVLVHRSDGAVEVVLIDCPKAETGWLAARSTYLRRSDLRRLVRSLLRAGAQDAECERLLRICAGDEAGELLARARAG